MAKFLDKIGLTFDDVCLVPVYNNVESRTEPILSTSLTAHTGIDYPIINSPMSTVVNLSLASALGNLGITPIFHRFYDNLEDLHKVVEEYYKSNLTGFFLSIGTKSDNELTHAITIAEVAPHGLRGVCIDVAHGHCQNVIDTVKRVKDLNPNLDVIVGNVCTARGTFDLINAGADAIRVGIGPGSNCSTRMVTGFGSPQLSALMECAEEASRHGVPVISDGGIRNSRDIVIALAAGASSVMLGRILAVTKESAAERRQTPGMYGHTEILYKGQASKDFQREGMAPEGVKVWLPEGKTVKETIEELMAGVRSGLTYGGARSIPELQRKAVFMPVSSTYIQESSPRG